MTELEPICANCGQTFTRPPSAPHKSFCSTSCRMAYHSRRRTEAFAALREAEAHQPPQMPEKLHSLFTRQHYVWLASFCRDLPQAPDQDPDAGRWHFITHLAAALKAENPAFDKPRFMDAVFPVISHH